jgi:Mrp family chromosome partitioning ATPase
MSKNFELLQRIGKPVVASSVAGDDSPSASGEDCRSDQVASCEETGPPRRSAHPLGAGADAFNSDGVLWQSNLNGAVQEQLVKLVQRVFVLPNSTGPRLVVFSGVDDRAPTSDICMRTSQVLAAQVSASVCIVEANLRSPSLHRWLNSENALAYKQVSNGIAPLEGLATRIGKGNLWVAPAALPALKSPAAAFVSDESCARIMKLREEFEYILINAPPVCSYADAVMLGQKADGVILVIEANSTRRETARVAKDALQAANVKLLGAVLNNRTFPIPEALYKKL